MYILYKNILRTLFLIKKRKATNMPIVVCWISHFSSNFDKQEYGKT
jgi:hypothetical protein